MYAREGSIAGWEKFIWESKGNGKVALKSNHNGKYVQAQLHLPEAPLGAFANNVQGWETFNWGTTSGKQPSNTELNQELSIYPNPVKASSTVTIAGANIGEYITIYNTIGQIMYQMIVSSENQEVSTIGFHSGMYFIEAKGKSVIKLVVQLIK